MRQSNLGKNFADNHFFESIDDLKYQMCSPYTVLSGRGTSIPPKGKATSILSKIVLDQRFKLDRLIKAKSWLKEDIKTIASNVGEGEASDDETSFGYAFSKKYGDMPSADDARAVVINWKSEIQRALSHINSKSLKGRILHVGCDAYFEPTALHENTKSILLIDVSKKLLTKAKRYSRKADQILTTAENLAGVPDKSIDLYIALRVFSSYNFDKTAALKEAARSLKKGGSILLSISNGYRAIDDTILPGQIFGSTPKLSLSQPFQHVLDIVILLSSLGFRELFLVPGSAELFLGGTFLSDNKIKNFQPILHVDNINQVPLCFYSVAMPTAWLGNYSRHPIIIDSVKWLTVEHFFQAQKFKNPEHRKHIKNFLTPEYAKNYAWKNKSEIRSDWNSVRTSIMQQGLDAKFSQHLNLRSALLKTNERELIETTSEDKFWGRTIQGNGRNMVGQLLMQLRKNI